VARSEIQPCQQLGTDILKSNIQSGQLSTEVPVVPIVAVTMTRSYIQVAEPGWQIVNTKRQARFTMD
jgi:hypothetical protein